MKNNHGIISDHWDRTTHFIAAPMADRIIMLDKEYDPAQLWLDLGHVFVFRYTESEEEKPKKARYRKKLKWEPLKTTNEAYSIYDYVPKGYYENSQFIEQYRILFSEGRLRRRRYLSREEIYIVFDIAEREDILTDWCINKSVGFWEIVSRAYYQRSSIIKFTSDEDAVKFKLDFPDADKRPY